MTGDITMHVEGLAELGAALDEMAKTTAKGVMQRILKAAAQPIADGASSLTRIGPDKHGKHPHKGGRLKRGWRVGTKLNPKQKQLEKKLETTSFTTMYVGAAPYAEAITEEFGTVRGVKPHPMLRPTWDAGKLGVLQYIQDHLGEEIEKTAKRAARRAALKAARS